jgi:hypothetical protein
MRSIFLSSNNPHKSGLKTLDWTTSTLIWAVLPPPTHDFVAGMNNGSGLDEVDNVHNRNLAETNIVLKLGSNDPTIEE